MKYQSTLLLPALAACLLLLCPNFALARIIPNATASETAHALIAGQHEAMEMVPAQADLTKALNAKKIKVGQTFDAKLYRKVDLKNGPVLPDGTELVGKVVKDQLDENGRPSILALRFTQAKPKNGKAIPIKATIVGVYPGSNDFPSYYGEAHTPNGWTPKTLQVEQINALNHVDLRSKIAARNSGVLQSTKRDIHFSSGTEFALAIAKRG